MKKLWMRFGETRTKIKLFRFSSWVNRNNRGFADGTTVLGSSISSRAETYDRCPAHLRIREIEASRMSMANQTVLSSKSTALLDATNTIRSSCLLQRSTSGNDPS